ncbi:MAG: hypothetical protein KUG83_01330 [Gammaproteobacteria bacterium]|nr:hypothetical protein [Gammaproteobacteria bacterium]
MKTICYFVSMLCILLGSGVCRAQVVGSSNSFCLVAAQGAFSNVECNNLVNGDSAYEEFRSRLWGELIQHVWKSSRKRHSRARLEADESEEETQKADAWEKMLRSADYDLRVSSNRFIMSIKVHF